MPHKSILSDFLSAFIVLDYTTVKLIQHDHYLVKTNTKHELIKDVYTEFDLEKHPKLLAVIPFLHQNYSKEFVNIDNVFTDFDANRTMLVYSGYLFAALKRIVMCSLADDKKCSVGLRLLDEWSTHIDFQMSLFNVRIVFGDLLKMGSNDWEIQNRIFLWYEWLFNSKVAVDFYPLVTENICNYINQMINVRQLQMSLAFCPRYFVRTQTRSVFIKLYTQLLRLESTKELELKIFEIKLLLPSELVDLVEWTPKYNSPLSLKALTRNVIRDSLLKPTKYKRGCSDHEFVQKVKKLPLPKSLLKFLRYF